MCDERKHLTYEERMMIERVKSDILSKIAKHQEVVDSSSFMIVEHYQNIKDDKERVMDWLNRLVLESNRRETGDMNLENDLKCLSSLIAIEELREQYDNIEKTNNIRGYTVG